MSDTLASLRRKINSADQLESVVRTMKAFAALNIAQYVRAVRALADYSRTVELGLGVCFRARERELPAAETRRRLGAGAVGAVVFGSDQGLVGQFNDIVADHALAALRGRKRAAVVWAVGERVHARLAEAGLPVMGLLPVPLSVKAIPSLVTQILVESDACRADTDLAELRLFHNRPGPGATYAPVAQRLLPLDEAWRRELAERPWPSNHLPEVVGDRPETVRALIREYLFASLFRACAESLASENASRLAAMQRAEKNIEELMEELTRLFNQLRQSGIDEELFDVIAGYESLGGAAGPARPVRPADPAS